MGGLNLINFRFNDNIYIDFGSGGQYYKVNKIENYDPTKITTCKVELIKTKEIAVPRATVINTAVVVGDNTATPYITPTYFYSRTNNVFNPNVQVFGNNNSIVRSSVILGNANNVVGSLNNITGDSNKLERGINSYFALLENHMKENNKDLEDLMCEDNT